MQVIHFANLAENGNDAFDNGKKSFSKRYVISNLNFNYNIDNNILYVRLIFSNFFFTNYKLFIHLHIRSFTHNHTRYIVQLFDGKSRNKYPIFTS